jgi:hypothetical protein
MGEKNNTVKTVITVPLRNKQIGRRHGNSVGETKVQRY